VRPAKFIFHDRFFRHSLAVVRLNVRHSDVARETEKCYVSKMSASSGCRMFDSLDQLPFNREHLKVMFVCALGSFFDVLELILSGVLSTVFSVKTSQVSASQLGWLLAAPSAGTVLGTPVLGWVADHIGRRSTMIGVLSILAVSSICAALSTDMRSLIGFRLLAGVAIGSYIAVMAAYLAEVMPVRDRGRMILIASALGSLAWPATILGTYLLGAVPTIEQSAWRFVCAAGAFGAALTAIIAIQLEESPRWLRARGQDARADAAAKAFVSARPLFQLRSASNLSDAQPPGDAFAVPHEPTSGHGTFSYLLHFALLGALQFLGPWSTSGFPLIFGAVLISRGFPVQDALLFTGISAIGAPIGLLSGSVIVDRFERRSILLLLAITMAAAVILFATMAERVALVGIAIVFTVCLVNYAQLLNIYVTESFPSSARAFATSAGWTTRSLAAVMVPLTLLPLLKSHGALVTCAAIASAMIASSALLGIAPRGRAGRPVI
jgi:MFS transporter, putative metabolite:H+ symporter